MRRLFITWLFAISAMAWAAEKMPSSPVEKRAENDVNAATVNGAAGEPTAKRAVSADTAAKLSQAAQHELETRPSPAKSALATEVAPVAQPKEQTPPPPQYQVFQMPRYVVREAGPNIPANELEVLTEKGRIEHAFDRRPGLRFGPLARLNRTIALEMLEDDLAAERRARAAELWSLYLIREPEPQVVVTATTR